MVEYTYDVWGKVLTVTGTLANTIGQLNPIRYRGYYYDAETGFYYCRSRYYDPETGRFINGDAYASTGQGMLGNNMFAYCGNNPVNKIDYSGDKPGDLFDTPDEAAIDFANNYNGLSIESNREYNTYIYSVTVVKKVTKTYYNPNLLGMSPLSWLWKLIFRGSYKVSVDEYVEVTKYTYREPNRGTVDRSHPPINWFKKDNVVAYAHTHGAYVPGLDSERFSMKDKSIASDAGIPFYLATPVGYVYKYDPINWLHSKDDVPIYKNAPYDPYHPWYIY